MRRDNQLRSIGHWRCLKRTRLSVSFTRSPARSIRAYSGSSSGVALRSSCCCWVGGNGSESPLPAGSHDQSVQLGGSAVPAGGADTWSCAGGARRGRSPSRDTGTLRFGSIAGGGGDRHVRPHTISDVTTRHSEHIARWQVEMMYLEIGGKLGYASREEVDPARDLGMIAAVGTILLHTHTHARTHAHTHDTRHTTHDTRHTTHGVRADTTRDC
jgi:hypothetical protein